MSAAGRDASIAIASATNASGSASRTPWPDTLEFLRWWIAGEKSLRLGRPPGAWVWTRHD